MSSAFDGKSALVSGASSGIGAAIAHQLGAANARLLITGRRTGALTRTAEQAGGAAIRSGDLTDPGFREELTRAVTDELGGLDLLVASAGITMNASFGEFRPEVLRRIMEVNFFATVELIRGLLPTLKERRGRIAVLSSITGLVGIPSRTAYSASKHALHGMFQALRVELKPDGVSVTLVCPGYVATKMRERALLGDGTVQGIDQAAGRQMLTAEQVAHRTLRAAARRRRLVKMGRETHLARWLSLFAPGLLERALQKATR